VGCTTPRVADPLGDFRKLAWRSGPEPDLGLAALLIARLEREDLAPAPWLARIDAVAARSGAAREAAGRPRLDRLRAFLFEEEGFRGNADDYYDPRNSCLDQVLERRLGIPITLSVLTMEVGRRVGLDIVGIGLPGHFLVGAALADGLALVDPFGGGHLVEREEAERLVAGAVGRPVTLMPAHFAPVSRAQIAARMLRNLKAIYAGRRDWARALAALDGILTVDPAAEPERKEREAVLTRIRRELALLN
jgi:regulator of sirC expression with transglutaminase-like and TPR domain